MATKTPVSPARSTRRGLGRGLAALIPESDFDMLSDVARGSIAPSPVQEPIQEPIQQPKDEKASSQQGASESPAKSASSTQSADKDAVAAKSTEQSASQENQQAPDSGQVRYLALSQIEANPFQPRQVWNEAELEDLAASLREHGVLQPILVRPLPGSKKKHERYQLIAGERRWRAAERAQIEKIPAIVREVDDKSALELAIIENVQRHDISAVESAHAYKRLSSEFNLSQEKIAARVGKSRASIANTMRLLDLADDALEALRNGEITEGHGRALLTASSDGARRALLRRVVRDHLSVRETERLAREGEAASQPNIRLPRADATDIARLEDTLQRALGLKLHLKVRKRGGQIIINYSSPEELQRLATRLSSSRE